jgi:hypothetical protein
LIAAYGVADLEFEVSDVALVGRQLAFQADFVPLVAAVKSRAASDDGVVATRFMGDSAALENIGGPLTSARNLLI